MLQKAISDDMSDDEKYRIAMSALPKLILFIPYSDFDVYDLIDRCKLLSEAEKEQARKAIYEITQLLLENNYIKLHPESSILFRAC